MTRGIGVHCALKDCLYYTNPRGKVCTCTHPDKTHYLTKDTCPLYRMDWARATDKVALLRRQFRVKTQSEMSRTQPPSVAPQRVVSFPAAASGLGLGENLITPLPAES